MVHRFCPKCGEEIFGHASWHSCDPKKKKAMDKVINKIASAIKSGKRNGVKRLRNGI